MSIKKVAVVGTGVLGTSWVTHFLVNGLKVVASDPAPGAEDKLRKLVAEQWSVAASINLTPGASIDNLSFSADAQRAVDGVDFVQENGPERLDLKRDLFKAMDEAAPAHAVLASSTSGLLASAFQADCKRPERVLIGHPFNPPHLIPLVEVVGGKATSAAAIDTAMTFYREVGKKPIHVKKELMGHIANRLQVALWREAFSLVARGIASVQEIDTAIAHGPGLRWALLGPFLNLHASGGAGGITHVLQHIGPSQRAWAADLGVYPQTDDYIAPCAGGVEAELAGYDFAQTLRQRDELLVGLLSAKKKMDQLP